MATPNHVLLRRITLSASAASVTFDSIPQTGYTDLKIVWSARTDRANNSSDIYLQFNNDTSATYSFKRLYGTGGATASDGLTNNSSGGFCGFAVGASATASVFSNNEIYIPNYTSNVAKSWSSDSVNENNASASNAEIIASLWNPSTQAAISTITLKDYNAANFVAGSSFSLYGIADVNTTPKSAPKADGGDIIKTDGTYWYHAFLSSGSFKPQLNLTADVLVVAGGGGGGGFFHAPGGGAGGLLYSGSAALTNANYAVTIGAGGSGGNSASYTSGTAGIASSFIGGSSSLTAVGGGAGPATGVGNSGGSGSGGGANDSAGGAGTSGQGNAGGSAYSVSPNQRAGGGGGASAVGAGGSTTGNGGAGVNTYSAWATATGTGASGYYAGGGGGGGQTIAGGSGGAGGGGAGARGANSASVAAVAGTPNTGGGGGGGASENNTSTINHGAAGGSGIVIIRYPV